MSDETTVQVDQQAAQQDTNRNEGIEKRIAELTAQKYAELERANQLQKELIAASQREAEQARQLAQLHTQPRQAPVDPLAAYADKVAPEVLEALRAQAEQTKRQLESQFAQRQTALELETGVAQLRNAAFANKGIPPEVAQRAEQLFTGWRNAGWTQPTAQDALHIALGQYHAGRPASAPAPQNFGSAPDVVPGFAPAPRAQAARPSKPANFDSLGRAQQNAILEQTGDLDQPF